MKKIYTVLFYLINLIWIIYISVVYHEINTDKAIFILLVFYPLLLILNLILFLILRNKIIKRMITFLIVFTPPYFLFCIYFL